MAASPMLCSCCFRHIYTQCVNDTFKFKEGKERKKPFVRLKCFAGYLVHYNVSTFLSHAYLVRQIYSA